MRHPDSTSDAAIIAASMSEPARFAAIFDRHAPSIHGYLTGRLGRQAAEDLVGETFLVAFDRRAKFDVRVPSARPWIYGIATRLVAQHRRDHARDVRLRLVTPAEPTAESHHQRVVERVCAQARTAALQQALEQLTDGDRDVVLLVAGEGLPYDDVALALDIPTGTVASRLNRARRILRAALGSSSTEVLNNG